MIGQDSPLRCQLIATAIPTLAIIAASLRQDFLIRALNRRLDARIAAHEAAAAARRKESLSKKKNAGD